VLVSTKVYDLVHGRAAVGVRVNLCRHNYDVWAVLSSGTTGRDGRLTIPVGRGGAYRLTYDISRYYAELGQRSIHPSITVEFTLTESTEQCEMVLLVTPNSYTTYAAG